MAKGWFIGLKSRNFSLLNYIEVRFSHNLNTKIMFSTLEAIKFQVCIFGNFAIYCNVLDQ